jgi:hypothetical protein
MDHPLDGARLKVVWADKHLRRFKLMAGCYKKGKLERFIIERTGKTIKAALREEASPLPDPKLSCIIGDFATNARAALDYIVWELASRYFDPPIDIKDRNDRRITGFPLFNDAADKGYADRLNRLSNRKIPALAIGHIRAVQPYNAGYESLWHLHEIVNRDKHRLPVLMNAPIVAKGPMSISLKSGDGRQDVAVGVGVAKSLEIDASHFVGELEMKVESQASIFIAFSDPPMPLEPADRTLENILKCVAEVVQRFDSFF